MKKISRIRWLTTLMGLVVLMFTCAGCGQTAAQSNVPKPDASQSRVRIYESMVELEDDSPLIITGEISRTSVIRDIDDIEKSAEIANNILKELEVTGVPNYFGWQRFGKPRTNTHLVGEALVQNDLKEAVAILKS
mgnify:FL=1